VDSIVAGIDVGGTAKGFHAVALRNGKFTGRSHFSTAWEVSDWCRDTHADIVAVDAPCRWSTTGRARPAECALAAARIFAYATPTLEVAEAKAFYRWMLNGAALYQLLEREYTLLDGGQPTGRICLETFPQAAACALAGRILPARQKCTNRREVLRRAGIDTAMLTNIDYVDAALCAVVAESVRKDEFTKYGDANSGFIFVPSFANA
jgi:predicted nuclease with RNAse H fold